MATFTWTKLQLANQALRLLGDEPITQAQLDATAGSYERADRVNEFYATVRDQTLIAHPWNFCLVRTTCAAFVEFSCAILNPAAVSGTCVTFTSNCNVFTLHDVGKTLAGDGVSGKATITKFTNCSTVEANITTAFSSVTAIACGSWRLYNWTPPGTDFAYSLLYPVDSLRIWRTNESERYAIENLGDDCNTMIMVTDSERITYRYIRQVTDETKFPPLFVKAFTAHLAAVMAERSSGQKALVDRMWGLYQAALKDARRVDGQEGTAERLNPNLLTGVRQGLWRGSWGGSGGDTWWP